MLQLHEIKDKTMDLDYCSVLFMYLRLTPGEKCDLNFTISTFATFGIIKAYKGLQLLNIFTRVLILY